jgi:hypothetical protein
VAAGPDLVYVRNSADPKGSMLVLSRARWADLIARVKERRGLEA